jgi:exopolysaccharide biosynthesis polyprenyl glycosylphosphotransferase
MELRHPPESPLGVDTYADIADKEIVGGDTRMHGSRSGAERSAARALPSQRRAASTAAGLSRAARARVHVALQTAAVAFGVAAVGLLGGGIPPVLIVPIAVVWLLVARSAFAAHGAQLRPLGVWPAALRGTGHGLLLVATLAFVFPSTGVEPRALVLSGLTVFAALVVEERAFKRVLEPRRRVLLLGASDVAREIVHESRAPHSEYEVVGVLAESLDEFDGELSDVAGAGVIDDLPDVLAADPPDLVVLALQYGRPRVFGPLIDAAESGFRVMEGAQFCEVAFGRVPVREVTRAWFMSVLHLYRRTYSRLAKRAFDVSVASFGLLLFAPLLPFVALAVKTSRGPLLFRQQRVGENGHLFTILKFRTMHVGAENGGQAIWATAGDTRITRVGRVLRRTRIDEIPQLWNVLRGDMSVVGPRPERPEFMEFLEHSVPFWSRRHLITPGITGWAQIRRGYTSDAGGSLDKLSYDLWYLRHRSLLVDIAICAMTVRALIRGEAASEGAPVALRVPVVPPDPLPIDALLPQGAPDAAELRSEPRA